MTRWPRGRYNGQRIAGVEITIRLNLFWWGFRLPSLKYGRCGSLGPVHVWLRAEYEHRYRDEGKPT